MLSTCTLRAPAVCCTYTAAHLFHCSATAAAAARTTWTPTSPPRASSPTCATCLTCGTWWWTCRVRPRYCCCVSFVRQQHCSLAAVHYNVCAMHCQEQRSRAASLQGVATCSAQHGHLGLLYFARTCLLGWWVAKYFAHRLYKDAISTYIQSCASSSNSGPETPAQSLLCWSLAAGVLEEHLQTTAETGKAALVKTAQGIAQTPGQIYQMLGGQAG